MSKQMMLIVIFVLGLFLNQVDLVHAEKFDYLPGTLSQSLEPGEIKTFHIPTIFPLLLNTNKTPGNPSPFTLVSGGINPAGIIVHSSDLQILSAATDLSEKLEAISGTPFEISTGSGATGIIIGLPGDFDEIPFKINFSNGPDPNLTNPEFLREQYIIHSTNSGVWLIGKTPLAVQHAVWDLLHQFGYRHYFANPIWEHIPSNDTLTINLSKEETPDYRSRNIWYRWGHAAGDATWGEMAVNRDKWSIHNRMADGFNLRSGHSYGSIISRNQIDFNNNHKYYALVDGERDLRSEAKLCIDNTSLVALSNQDAIREIEAHPKWDSVSRDPSDGGSWCECDGTPHETHNPDNTNCIGNFNSISDRALHLSNQAAQALIEAGYDGITKDRKYVGMYSYNQHQAPPTIDGHPNVMITVANGFLTYDHDYLMTEWSKKVSFIGIYEYYGFAQWGMSRPREGHASSYHYVADTISKWNNMEGRFFSAESSDAWGPYGLGYYTASRLLWNTDEADDIENFTDEFLTLSFGPAKESMVKFYHLLYDDEEYRDDADIIARMFFYLKAARDEAFGRSDVLARINDLIKYTHYFELQQSAIYYQQDPNADNPGTQEMLKFAHQIRKTDMIDAYGLWCDYFGSGKTQDILFRPELRINTPVTESDVVQFLNDGYARYVTDPTPDFHPDTPYPSFIVENKVYSTDLVPVLEGSPIYPLTHPSGEGYYPDDSQNEHHYFLWVEADQTTITFDIVADPIGDQCKMKLYHSDHGHNPVHTLNFESPSSPLRLTLDTNGYTGLFEAVLAGSTGQSEIDWSPTGVSDGVKATLMSSPYQEPDHTSEQFDYHRFMTTAWQQFFYVPSGTTTIGFWANRMGGSIRDNNNQPVQSYSEDPAGWYQVNVPEGQDGKVWKVESHTGGGIRLLSTVPPYYAKTVDDLLLPREVVYGIVPGQATNPLPGNGASLVNTYADLSWGSGQATATQELYFGTTNPPVSESSLTGTDNNYDLGTLSPGTTYYWRIDANNINGQKTGTVWSFTTAP